MRPRLACSSLSVLALCLTLAAPGAARAEGVARKPKKPSTVTRLRGASSVVPVPWGLVAMGGPQLRHLPTGKSKWETLHTVKGDNLYRIAADDGGRLLASWENDPSFHLFVPATKEHRTFAKPPSPGKPFITWSLDALFFDRGGKDVIVYMHGYTGGTSWAVAAYRYAIDGKAGPTELFRQSGYQLHVAPRLSLYLLAKDPSMSCDGNGCSVASLVAWEITDTGARQQVLLDGAKRQVTHARLVAGSDDERVAVVLEEQKGGRLLLRWRRGDAAPTLVAIPKARWEAEALRFSSAGDVLELWIPDDRSLEIWRFPVKGERQVVVLPPLERKKNEDPPDFGVYAFKERKNGDFFLHWGDFLYLLPREGVPRRLPLVPLLGKHNEWAGAAIYVAEPETLWIGVEVGGRDFLRLGFDEIDKRATPLPAPADPAAPPASPSSP